MSSCWLAPRCSPRVLQVSAQAPKSAPITRSCPAPTSPCPQVRSLGRGGGTGPLRRAPQEVPAARCPPGVVRSGSLSLMLPSEAALLALGWPREHSEDDESEREVEARGSHPARLLFLARLAEKGLMSYERAGEGLQGLG